MKPSHSTSLTMTILMALSWTAQATDYKCHVRAVDHGERIVLIDTHSVEDAQRAAAAARVAAVKGGAVAVAEALECRLESQPFGTARARALDQMTPR